MAGLGMRPVVKMGWWPQAEDFWSVRGPGQVFLLNLVQVSSSVG